MVPVHLHRRDVGLWCKAPMALLYVATCVAATLAFTGSAIAQVVEMPVTPQPGTDCAPRSSDRPIQFAATLTSRLEPGAGPLNTSKASAILGGALSKLEQMRTSQATGEMRTATIASAAPAIIPDPINRGCTDAPTATVSFAAPHPAAFVPENAILGTLSVAIKHSPFDRNWAAVSAKRSSHKIHRVLAATGARHSGDRAAQVEAVNRWVNRSIQFGEDRDVYGRADYWATASETFRRGIGDCEDFAIAKMELLAALGIARDKMRLVVARDLVRNADHAVLVVTLADRAVMLDNMTDRLLDARLPNDYRPIMSFSQNAKWVHGYAVQPTEPVRMASVAPVPQPAASRVRDVLTVTAEPELPVVSVALLSAPSALPTVL